MPEWLASVPGVREHEPLAPHSWYGIGGRARYFLEVNDDCPLAELVGRLTANEIPYLVIGAATNTLFAADEQPGLTIKLKTFGLSIEADHVTAAAGVLMPKLAAETAKAGRAGMEFGAGVPGTVGGSVFGNAGAFGSEVNDRLIGADGLDPSGRRLCAEDQTLAGCRSRSARSRRSHLLAQRWSSISAGPSSCPIRES